MGQIKPFLWGVALVAVWLLTASDIVPVRYGSWTPYFMDRSELERSVFWADGAEDVVNPGKIWIAANTIYVVERYRGVHVIDNADPANPRQKAFLVAPGCMDVAVKEDIIYLDNAVDLVTFDMTRGVETHRLKNYFPEPASPTGDRYYNHASDKILVGWKQTEKTEGRP